MIHESRQSAAAAWARLLGERIHAARKAQGLSVVSAAEAAGISRITWHRLESGHPQGTLASYANAMAVLGLTLGDPTRPAQESETRSGWIPARVNPAEFPQLQQLAWHVARGALLTPQEALDIYERNERHIDSAALSDAEGQLISDLRTALRRGHDGV